MLFNNINYKVPGDMIFLGLAFLHQILKQVKQFCFSSFCTHSTAVVCIPSRVYYVDLPTVEFPALFHYVIYFVIYTEWKNYNYMLGKYDIY